jgi:hypothetical protein
MSRNKGVGKLYDRLTPSERFRLDVEAQARGDEAESRRLVDSCPIRNYRMTDWAFSGRWQTTTEIVLAVCVDLFQYMSRLNMIDAIRETLPYAHVVYHNEMDSAYLSGHETGSRYAWERAGMEGDPPGWAPLDEDGESTDAEDFDPAIDAEFETTGARLEEADIMPELLTRLEEKTTQEIGGEVARIAEDRIRETFAVTEFDPDEVYGFMNSEEAAEFLGLPYSSFREIAPSLPRHAITPARFGYLRRELLAWGKEQ